MQLCIYILVYTGEKMFNENALYALLLATIAGMSTLLGAVIIFITKKKNEKLVSISLGFAAGIMISVSFTDLLPTADGFLKLAVGEKWGIALTVVFLVVGMVAASLLDRLLPHQSYDETLGERPHKDLFRVGVVSTLAIGFHNFPEGIATFMAGYEDISLGISIAIAIALHNIPEGISVAMPIYFATGSRQLALRYTFLSGIAEPIGALLAFLVLKPFINGTVMGAMFAFISGIMLYIAIEELIPTSRQYGNDRAALIATFAGICIMPLTHMI